MFSNSFIPFISRILYMNKSLGIMVAVMAAAIVGTLGVVHTAFAQTASTGGSSVGGSSTSASQAASAGASSASTGTQAGVGAHCTANNGIAGPTGGFVVIGGGVGQSSC